MASSDHVRHYLAYWFQLGKAVVLADRNQRILPRPVIAGNRYSPEFEACWQTVQTAVDAYLEGTQQTIGELLTPSWELNSCARCAMPVPTKVLGLPTMECPCIDLPTWPDTEMPQPRQPVDSRAELGNIRDRLQATSQ
jgi:hypothetical protein